MDDKKLILEKIRLLEAQETLASGLPHLHGWNWYAWAREFFECKTKIGIITAANQISKSSSLIRKNIEWAGNTKLWPLLWRSSPKIFWYFYPSMDVATVEVEKKWVPEFLPRGAFKDHPTYGWKLEYKHRKIHAIHFNSGVSIYFKSYEQSVMNLQSSSVYLISIDEELPVDFWDELYMRTNAVDGYIFMVFTATLGQEFWRRVMECRGTPQELLPEASKWQVSMYDCLKYDDGTDTPWSIEKIKRVERSCQSQAEILKRVYGRFVVASGLKYPGFDSIRNMKIGGELPREWLITGAVDIGGGGNGHPSAISFIGITPNFQKARVIKLWRGDGIITTAGDALLKYIELRDEVEQKFARKIHRQFYDWASKDFQTIAQRMGENFEQADKDHILGEQVMNTLFQNDMLSIDAECGIEGDKLSVELATIQKDMAKNKCKDDLTDSLRYNVTKAPWDFSVLANFTVESKEPVVGGIDELARSGKMTEEEYRQDRQRLGYAGDEFQEWNELY